MDDEILLVGDPIPLHEARFYFHEVSPQMLASKGFPEAVKKAFVHVFYDE